MRVIFVHHSCFAVEVDELVLVFDYFAGDRVNGYTFTGKLPDYAPETRIYMFASHKHQDHFDMDILRWSERYPNIRYILSKDIRISPHFLSKHGIDPAVRERVTFVSANNSYKVDELSVQTLLSNDAGVAFYVTVRGVSLFHAGDLNDWKMENAGEEANEQQEQAFYQEIKKLADKSINLAFVPMDPRLGMYQTLGVDYILKNTDAEVVFPMHMWQDYSAIEPYRKRITDLGMANRLAAIEHENQIFPFGEL